MILVFYRLLFVVLAPFVPVFLWLRGRKGLEETKHFPERRGIASFPRPSGKLIWVHAASVGEMRSVLPLLRSLLDKNADLTCLVTTVTVTAARMVRRLNEPRIIHQYVPLDHPKWVARFLDHWKPNAVLWLESEFWPTMLLSVRVPLVLVNGRLSERSAARWTQAPGLIRKVLNAFDLTLAQTEEDGARLRALGATKVIVAGNMKYAAAPQAPAPEAVAALQAAIAGRPVVLYASTHEGEEELAAHVHGRLIEKHPTLLSIIMPRHARRSESVLVTLDKAGIKPARRSIGADILPTTGVYLADTMGETALFCSVASIVFVGNSMVQSPGGGHNPIEPAYMDCAVLYGPNMWNFTEIDRDLRAVRGAQIVRDERDLANAIDNLIQKPSERDTMAKAAKQFVAAQQGILDTVNGHLRSTLEATGIKA